MTKSRPIIIDVTGGSGSGKTSVGRAIFSSFPGHSIVMLEQDSYYKDQSRLSFRERLSINYDHPFTFDNDLLIQHVGDLLSYKAIEKPVYDCTARTRSQATITQEPKEVVILGGVLILEDERLRDSMDIKVYVDTNGNIRIIRHVKRDMEGRGHTSDSVIEQYLTATKPVCHQFIESTKRYADIVVPEGGKSHVVTDLITAKVASFLNHK